MKKSAFPLILLASIVLGGMAMSVLAVTMPSSDDGIRYVVESSDLSKWTAGIYWKERSREVEANGLDYNLDRTKIMAYFGYDPVRWLTTYCTFGTSDFDVDAWNDTGTDGNSDIGIGLHFKILDHDIFSPTLMEDMFRISGGWEYTQSYVEWDDSDQEISELYGWLTIGIVNIINGNKYFVPNGISLFFGPLYSDLRGGPFDETNKAGFTIGLEFYYVETITFNMGVEYFDAQRFFSGVHVRF